MSAAAAAKNAAKTKPGRFRLRVPAGKAAPGPPVGSAFGPRALKAMDFAREFNTRTANIEDGTPMRVWVSYAADRSFTFDIRMPETQWFIRKAAGIEQGAATPPTGDYLLGVLPEGARTDKEEVGTMTLKHVYEIARLKNTFDATLKYQDLAGVCATVISNAKAMGVRVVP